jgi:hypothetical protein
LLKNLPKSLKIAQKSPKIRQFLHILHIKKHRRYAREMEPWEATDGGLWPFLALFCPFSGVFSAFFGFLR